MRLARLGHPGGFSTDLTPTLREPRGWVSGGGPGHSRPEEQGASLPQSCILQSKGASILPPPLLALQREVSRGVKGTGGNKRGSGQKAELVLQFSCVKRLLTTVGPLAEGGGFQRRFGSRQREPGRGQAATEARSGPQQLWAPGASVLWCPVVESLSCCVFP